MRTIKFRAWDADWKRMVYPIGLDWETKDEMIMRYWCSDNNETKSKTGIPCHKRCSNIMQFTGLKDKNGKEIYEGDMIKVTSHDSRFDGKIEQVFWWHGQFVFKASDWQEHDYINFGWWIRSNEMTTRINQVEVIGNIHESPELI